MKIISGLSSLAQITEPYGLTIGNFDGVHLGHQFFIRRMIRRCRAQGLKCVLLTFVPHPQMVVRGCYENFLINSYSERRILLANLGVDYLCEIEFNRDLSTMDSHHFLLPIVSDEKMKIFFIGHDFSFGKNREGDRNLLFQLAQNYPFKIIHTRQLVSAQVAKFICSTSVRELIRSGDLSLANRVLGRPFFISGHVIRSRGIGKKIGFPTANIELSSELLRPQAGVYHTTTILQGRRYPSVTSIGVCPTFDDVSQTRIETHLLDFEEDIYGETIIVEFARHMREEKKYQSIEELIQQIHLDVQGRRLYE